MPLQDQAFTRLSDQRSSVVLVEQRRFGEDLGGAPFAVYEHTLPQGAAPTAGSFGYFRPYVYNERNNSMSRHRVIQVDVNAGAITFRYKTLDDGSRIQETRQIVQVDTPLAASAVNLLNATRQKLDDNHEMMVEERFQSFPTLHDIEQANPQYEGLDTLRSRVRIEPPTVAVLTIDLTPLTPAANLLVAFGANGNEISSVSVSVDPVALVDDFSDPANPVLKASSTRARVLEVFAQLMDDYEVPYGYTYTIIGNILTVTHYEPGPTNIMSFQAGIWNGSFFTSFQIPYTEVAGTGSETFLGKENTEGWRAQAETDTRQMSEEISVLTPTGNEQITMRDWIPSLQTEQVYKKVEVVGTNSDPNATYLDVAIQDKKISYGKKLRTRFAVLAWESFTDYEIDPETQEVVTITRTIRDKATYTHSTEARVEVTAKQMDHLRVLETRKAMSDSILSKTFKTHRNIQYKFPGWLVPGSEYHIYDYFTYSSQTVDYIADLNEKNGQILTVPAEVYTSYHPTKPIAPDVFQFFTTSTSISVDNDSIAQLTGAGALDRDIINLLRSQPIVVDDMIVNTTPAVWEVKNTSGASISGFTLHVLARTQPSWIGAAYGGTWTYTKVRDIPASSPNASVYVTMMLEGTLVLVGVEITQWKYNLWKQVRTYIKIPNLITPDLVIP